MAQREKIIQKTEAPVSKELLSGSFSETSFFDVCREIALPKWTGTLVVKESKREYRFYFKDGEIIYSEDSSEKTEVKIFEIIRNSGLISRETFVNCEKKKAKVMRSLLEILIEDGHVSMLLYSKVISAVVRVNIIKMLLLKKGSYSFFEKKIMREVHGVRPVSVLDIRDISTIADNHRKELGKVIKNFYRHILNVDKNSFLSEKKSLLQNYLVCEIDFFTFITKSVEGLSERKWKMQGIFSSIGVLQTATLYIFRGFVFLGVLVFLYLALVTGAFKDKKEPRSVEDFYFFKVEMIALMLEFESGKKPSVEMMLQSGMLSQEEINISRFSGKEKDK